MNALLGGFVFAVIAFIALTVTGVLSPHKTIPNTDTCLIQYSDTCLFARSYKIEI